MAVSWSFDGVTGNDTFPAEDAFFFQGGSSLNPPYLFFAANSWSAAFEGDHWVCDVEGWGDGASG